MKSAFETFQVILERGPKGDKHFAAEPAPRARQRADALRHLHSCSMTVSETGIITVHASDWYTPKRAEA